MTSSRIKKGKNVPGFCYRIDNSLIISTRMIKANKNLSNERQKKESCHFALKWLLISLINPLHAFVSFSPLPPPFCYKKYTLITYLRRISSHIYGLSLGAYVSRKNVRNDNERKSCFSNFFPRNLRNLGRKWEYKIRERENENEIGKIYFLKYKEIFGENQVILEFWILLHSSILLQTWFKQVWSNFGVSLSNVCRISLEMSLKQWKKIHTISHLI